MQTIIKWKISTHSASAQKNANQPQNNPQPQPQIPSTHHVPHKDHPQTGDRWPTDSNVTIMRKDNHHYKIDQQHIKISTLTKKLIK